MTIETLDQLLESDLAGRFDVTDAQARCIADHCTTAGEWIDIWENKTWWKTID
jgi:hypothetical protein